jgi:uncharacterized membrane protein
MNLTSSVHFAILGKSGGHVLVVFCVFLGLETQQSFATFMIAMIGLIQYVPWIVIASIILIVTIAVLCFHMITMVPGHTNSKTMRDYNNRSHQKETSHYRLQ